MEQQLQECDFYMDGILKQNLDIVKGVIKKDWDFVYIIDGVEGGGKSVFAQQLAKYCDNSFNIDRVCFTPDDLKDCILKCNKYESIVYDESYFGLSSKGSMEKVNKELVSLFAECRQQNLFVFIVLPTFFDLTKNIALWRSKGLFHIYLGKNFERGYFKFYNYLTKKYLYVKGKEFYDYKKVMPNIRGRFTKKYTIDEKEYREKKLNNLRRYNEKQEKKEPMIVTRYKERIGKLTNVCLETYNHQELAAKIGVNRKSIAVWKANCDQKNSLTYKGGGVVDE